MMRSFTVSFKYRDSDSRNPTHIDPRIATASDLQDLLKELFETELADGRLTELQITRSDDEAN